ncbi:PAS domain S-box protein [Chryseolinea sp. H1M3-3]|uniref:PAS domain S-box protein n=1 Tax=Chryseolinea sp. H1M3-3 TaxID=3034144 RepID=UPI0023ECF417|nr:PAS domain S-box protein [Chryseolinea sp. H1M3-3]
MRSPLNKSDHSSPSLSNEGICRSIVERSNAILLTIANGTIVDGNENAAAMFGYALEELKSSTRQILFEENFERVFQRAKCEEKYVIESYAIRKNGDRFPCEVSWLTLENVYAEDLFSISVVDISKRQMLEAEKIRNAEDRGRGLIERVSDSFVSLDRNFRFTYVNKRGAELANRTVDSLLGKHMWEEFPDIVGSNIYFAYHKAMIEQVDVHTEFYYEPFNIWLEYHIYPSPDGVSAFIRNITETKRRKSISELEKNIFEFYTNSETPIEEILTLLLNGLQRIHPHMLCSILKVKNDKLFTWVSPHLPSEFNQAIDGIPVGSGSCGVAAQTKRKVFVKDIVSDPITKDYGTLAEQFQLKSCWSYPILDIKQNVLGTFAIYYTTTHEVKPSEEDSIDKASIILKTILINKQAQDAVKKSEQTRRLIMNAALDAIICIDTAGQVTLWNPQAEKIFGWKEEEVLGIEISDLILPENFRDRHFAGLGNYLRTAQSSSMLNKVMEVTAKNRQGIEFPISLTILPVKQDNSEFFCAFIEDISEKKEAQSQLQKAHTQLLSAQQIAKLGYWELDLIGNANYWSTQIYEICGLDKKANVASIQEFADLIHPDDRQEFLENHRAALQGIPFLKPDYRLIRKDGDLRYILIEASRVCDDKGTPIRLQGTLQDITRLKKNELALIELNNELNKRAMELAKSNAELEQFAYITSHDLQEPLRMVTSFLTQIEKKYNDILDEKGRQYIHFAVDGAARMKRIILDLLEYSRVGKSDSAVQKIDMNELLKEIVQLNQTTIEEKNAEVIWHDLPVIQFSKTPLQQVLHNLVGNGLKYQRPGQRPRVEIRFTETLSHWQFSIADNGIGIDPKNFDAVFVLFKRLHNRDEFSGTGLGLAICKKIVESYQGKIWVDSSPGVGSTFHFTIPKHFGNLY